jgi:protein-tyrosine phosphatase
MKGLPFRKRHVGFRGGGSKQAIQMAALMELEQPLMRPANSAWMTCKSSKNSRGQEYRTRTLEGHLFLHSMPGRYEPIEEFLTDIVVKNISCVVCLASQDEIGQRSPAYATLLGGTVPWEHIAFPIWNLGTPDELALEPLPREIVKRLREGRNVLIHCDAGIGRAGSVAVAVLLNFWPLSHNAESATAFERRA